MPIDVTRLDVVLAPQPPSVIFVAHAILPVRFLSRDELLPL